MLRAILIGYGLLSLLSAVVLLLVFHIALWPVIDIAANGLILVAALLLERKRYKARVDRTRGDWQPTDERFVDPTTNQLMEVFYNPATGQRDYRKVINQP